MNISGHFRQNAFTVQNRREWITAHLAWSEPIMDFIPPTLPQFPHHSTETVVVKLSALSDDLRLQVPDAQDTPANWEVYPILGPDPEQPEWQGVWEPTGVWNEALDDMLSLTGVELSVPRSALENYLNGSVELRYKFADESSLELCSEPLRLTIEA